MLRVSSAAASASRRCLVRQPLAASPAVFADSVERRNNDLCRFVHSKRQIKKRFRQPTRARFERKAQGIDDRARAPPPEREFPPVFKSAPLPNGWSPPPPDDFVRPEYPFSVSRTRNKPHGAPGFLPVYSNYRKDGTKTTTIIRKVKGDIDRFVLELRAVCQIPFPKNPRDDAVRIRAGSIEINGARVGEVKRWLAGLGF